MQKGMEAGDGTTLRWTAAFGSGAKNPGPQGNELINIHLSVNRQKVRDIPNAALLLGRCPNGIVVSEVIVNIG